ncbi:MAG: hypothetical protein LBK77_01445 [Spirochaetaceae bacterium]|jgi:hypothetical protein|nr:hypothetical protein [Spirochaetaceae bacterium]
MFFRTKQKTVAVPGETPRDPRYTCIAKVSINGFEGEAVLRNVNRGGFCMESRTYIIIKTGENYVMQIKPETASGMDPFEMKVEVRWVRSAESNFNSGFLIAGNRDISFENYVNYIKTRTLARGA